MSKLLEVTGISKRFPSVVANDDISFEVARGEIHALLGENGAGKSTLVKIIYGVMQPDSGAMRLNGSAYAPPSPAFARASGIAMVFQHFSLFEAMTVSENIALGLKNGGTGAQCSPRIREFSTKYGLSVNPDRYVGDLSVGERQRVEILRCLMQSPSLLIMDEPTSVLTPQEADGLFVTLRRLSENGVAILYISHRLMEIRELCHAATVLRGGRVVATCDPRRETARSLAEMMIGTTLAEAEAPTQPAGEIFLEANCLSAPAAGPFRIALRDISFSLRAGEILGIAGVAGNGQTELMEALTGECITEPDMLRLHLAPVGAMGPSARRRAGMAFAPEERLGVALSPDMSLTDNVLITARDTMSLSRFGLLRMRSAAEFARSVIEAFDVRTSGPEQEARCLSGGNLQKYVIGREILQKPSVLVASQPTWGVDASAAAAIHRALADMATKGAAVLLISQDLDELMRLSTRFAVLSDGQLSEAKPTKSVTVEQVGLMMGGARSFEEQRDVAA